jgi:hypothetical protein
MVGQGGHHLVHEVVGRLPALFAEFAEYLFNVP